MPDIEALALWIALSVGLCLLLACGALFGHFFSKFGRADQGDAATRARRDAAMLRGSVSEGVPFEHSGQGRGTDASLNLDLDFGAEGIDISAAVGRSGIRLEYELWVGERVIEQHTLQLPKDRMPRDTSGRPYLHQIETMGRPTTVQCTLRLTHFAAPMGVAIRVRGRAHSMPNNHIRSAQIWVG